MKKTRRSPDPKFDQIDVRILILLDGAPSIAWLLPRQVGGYDANKGSLHASRLRRLTNHGHADRELLRDVDPNAKNKRRAYAYRITESGRALLRELTRGAA